MISSQSLIRGTSLFSVLSSICLSRFIFPSAIFTGDAVMLTLAKVPYHTCFQFWQKRASFCKAIHLLFQKSNILHEKTLRWLTWDDWRFDFRFPALQNGRNCRQYVSASEPIVWPRLPSKAKRSGQSISHDCPKRFSTRTVGSRNAVAAVEAVFQWYRDTQIQAVLCFKYSQFHQKNHMEAFDHSADPGELLIQNHSSCLASWDADGRLLHPGVAAFFIICDSLGRSALWWLRPQVKIISQGPQISWVIFGWGKVSDSWHFPQLHIGGRVTGAHPNDFPNMKVLKTR